MLGNASSLLQDTRHSGTACGAFTAISMTLLVTVEPEEAQNEVIFRRKGTNTGEKVICSFMRMEIVRLLMTPTPSVLRPHAPLGRRHFIRNFGCDWSVPVWLSCKRGQIFALRDERAMLRSYMPSV